MESAPDLRIIPATQTPWGDIAQVFGTRSDPARCWCQYFKVTNKEWNSATHAGSEGRNRGNDDHVVAGC